jgi:tRNA dimethylallyltransferase
MNDFKKNYLIVISGPTASGKTSLSLRVAREIQNKYKKNACIINFDSLLFYKELNIGTAKPTNVELSEIEHKLINIRSIKNPINSFEFVALASEEISKAHLLGKIPILVGGSAFYLRAMFTDMYNSKTSSPEIKKQLDELLAEEGINGLLNILKEKDPESFRTLHKNDHYRIYRAVEHFFLTNIPISEEKKKREEKNPYLLNPVGLNFFHCYLNPPKEIHLNIIKERTEKMLKDGLIEEVKGILSQGFGGEERPLRAIGYQEVISYLNGEIKTLEDLSEKIFISTRQLAKSQKTFFKKITPKIAYDPIRDIDKILKDLDLFLNQ